MRLIGSHTTETAERIVQAFRSPENLPKALAPIFIHRKDETPCRKWSWHNQLLAALCGTADARGIRQWNQVGRKVKKGSTAIWILAPCLKKVTEEGGDGAAKERQILYGFRSVPVFAVEDTEGEPLPESDPEMRNWLDGLPLLDVANAWGIHVDAYSGQDGAALGYYRYAASGKKAIMVGVENLSTWAHELVHAADHRITGLRGGKPCQEIVAELGGAILLECLGMQHESDLGGVFQYIEAYARDAGKDTIKACIDVLSRTCDCVQLILDTAENTAESSDNQALAATA